MRYTQEQVRAAIKRAMDATPGATSVVFNALAEAPGVEETDDGFYVDGVRAYQHVSVPPGHIVAWDMRKDWSGWRSSTHGRPRPILPPPPPDPPIDFTRNEVLYGAYDKEVGF